MYLFPMCCANVTTPTISLNIEFPDQVHIQFLAALYLQHSMFYQCLSQVKNISLSRITSSTSNFSKSFCKNLKMFIKNIYIISYIPFQSFLYCHLQVVKQPWRLLLPLHGMIPYNLERETIIKDVLLILT